MTSVDVLVRPASAVEVDGISGTDRWIEGGSLVAVTQATRRARRDAGTDAVRAQQAPKADAEEIEPGGRIVGHLLLSEGDLRRADGGLVRRIWMVGPVAVTPDQQRRGVGTALMQAAIGLAIDRGQPLLCLLGHATYYPRFGFEPARAIGIEPPRPWRDANWMALRLPAWDAELRGTAHYPPAFADE